MAVGALSNILRKGRAVAKTFGQAFRKGLASKTKVMSTGTLAQKAAYYWETDIGVGIARGVGNIAKEGARMAARAPGRKSIRRALGRTGHYSLAALRSPLGKIATRATFALGTVGMMGVGVMNGGMSSAKEIVHERYMQDYTYSKSMLHNSRVGLASGTSRMLDRAGTQGLTGALHKTRHGRY